MHDVIVCDEEFEQAASTVSDVCSQLEDLLRGGVYGASNRDRLHSSNMTLNAVSADKDTRVPLDAI